jgi:hypothetical protein
MLMRTDKILARRKKYSYLISQANSTVEAPQHAVEQHMPFWIQ